MNDVANQNIYQLFALQVERTPTASAVIFQQETLNYQELKLRVDSLADALTACGIGSGSLVGIFVERSVAMVVAILAVFKCGAAYVPLAVEYPSQRIAYILQDAQIHCLLTHTQLLEHLPSYAGMILCLDRQQDMYRTGEVRTKKAEDPLTGDAIAYVMYTSGSTGHPKGVVVTHCNIINYLFYLIHTYQLGATDRVLQLAPLSFDPSVRDILGTLIAGATLIIIDGACAKTPSCIVTACRIYQVTVILSMVPTVLRTLLASARIHDSLPALRLLLVSGEVLYLSDCIQVHRVFGPQVFVFNQYGPTECTMACSRYPVVDEAHTPQRIPIGQPIDHMRFYVLDSHLQPVPPDTAGELYIAGVGLALGYHRHPDLTAERFLPHPYSTKPGMRLYRTGDLVRYLPDGNMEFLGRNDRQVKVHGVRVELAEVEACLLRYGAVQSSAVVAEERGPGDTRLIAYVQAMPGQHLSPQELRNFLQGELPVYLLPSVFIVLEKLPRLPNGKVDLLALASLKVPEAMPHLPAAPRNPLEERIASIWTSVLGSATVGIHDQFFALGGHSLLAAQIIYLVNEAFYVQLPLHAIFEASTVSELAALVERKQIASPLALLLTDIEQLSADEVQQLLAVDNGEDEHNGQFI